MPFDREQYRHHLASLTLSREAEDELLDFANLFLEEIISVAFGTHTVQQTNYMPLLLKDGKPINNNMLDGFNDAAE